MKCSMCGSDRMKSSVGNHRFDFGLDEKVTLVGIPIDRCLDCGEEAYGIPRMNELFRVVAKAVASKQDRLTPKEVTFIREHLELENDALAELMGISLEQVRRWQREKGTPIPMAAERLLRTLVLGRADIATLLQMATRDRKPFRSRVLPVDDHWEVAA